MAVYGWFFLLCLRKLAYLPGFFFREMRYFLLPEFLVQQQDEFPVLLHRRCLPTGTQWADLSILWVLISIAGILGNLVGYWFGKKSGPFLFERKDTFLFKKKYLDTGS